MPARLRFARFELQPRERRLLADGVPAPLQARAFDLLLALARRPGQLVTKHELLDEVWPGLVVEEANLTVQVSSLRKVLGGDVIATIPGRGYRFAATLEADGAVETRTDGPAAAPATPAAPALVAPPLIGRDADLARLQAALRQPGCVTLTGPAGVGKTSLARVLAAHWEAGAIWVDLAPLVRSDAIAAAVAHALDLPVPPDDTPSVLARALGVRLLVLDNAEHLVEAAAVFAGAVLAAAPAACVLATSQLPLALSRERVQRIDPLALPSEDAADDAQAQAGALALLVERAQAADHRFRAEPGSRPLLAEICRRLDGVPLALEMAAARVPLLGLRGVRDALTSGRFEILRAGYRDAPGRHRSLHAALDWSHALLGAAEQRLFRRLAVFSGGFTLDLAVSVAGDEEQDRWELIDTLAVLVDRSLVAADPGDAPRYRLLETMRAYALEQLAAAGEEDATRRRLVLALCALFAPAVAFGADRRAALAEHDNARDSIAWALAHEPALAVELAPLVTGAAAPASWRVEAVRWLQASESATDDARIKPALRAAWWYELARQQVMSYDPRARATALRAQALYRAIGDELGMFNAMMAAARASTGPSEELERLCEELQATAHRHPEWPGEMPLKLAGALAHARGVLGDAEGQLQHRKTELALARQLGLTLLAEVAENNIVSALLALGRADEALQRNTELLARIGGNDTINAAYAWHHQLEALIALRRFDEVRRIAPQALAVMRRFQMPNFAEGLALMAALEGRHRAAARLAGQARRVYADEVQGIDSACARTLERVEALAREQLDAPTWDALVEQGRGLDSAAADRLLQATDDA